MKEMLEILKEKVDSVVDDYKKLQEENKGLKYKLQSLSEEKEQLETSLLREHDNLAKEKDSIKGVVEALLENINKLEASKE